jgi:hypothetical protein
MGISIDRLWHDECQLLALPEWSKGNLTDRRRSWFAPSQYDIARRRSDMAARSTLGPATSIAASVYFVRCTPFLVDGDPKPAVASIKKHLRIYPLAQAANSPVAKFTNATGVPHNTVHANNFHLFEEVNDVVQEEPAAALDPETLGLLASIGIEKG